MQKATLHIRNMISSRDVKVVKEELEKLGAKELEKTSLGKAVIEFDNKQTNLRQIEQSLGRQGFEVIKDRDEQLVEQIKVAAIELIYHAGFTNSIIRNSDYLSDKIGQPYSQLSKAFSDKTGTTLEKYIILLKIEKVKELISYNELTLSEISYQLGYSSVQYLSNQFKQITGYAPTEYKNQGIQDRRPLDRLV